VRPIQILGVVGVVTGGFSFTKSEKKAELGPVEVRVKEEERVNVPLWASAGAIAVGTVLLLVRRRG
jgi:hypothetical protein